MDPNPQAADAAPLWTLGYISVAQPGLDRADLKHILHVSHRDNPPRQVTGLLVHCCGNFMQVLEGPKPGVHEIFRRIRASPLHSTIRVLFDEPLPEREFGDWAMFCKEVDEAEFRPVLTQPQGSSRRMLAHFWRAWDTPLRGAGDPGPA